MTDLIYDTVIIGAGPSGMTAALYAKLYKLNSICIGDVIGGKLIRAPGIFDYPGFEQVPGKQIVQALTRQLSHVQATVVSDTVEGITKEASDFVLHTQQQATYRTKTIILATGNGNKQPPNRGVLLVQSLGVVSEKGFIPVNEYFQTIVSGIFASGDCVLYPHSLEQTVTAVQTGVSAAAGVYTFLTGEKPPILWGEAEIPRL